MAYRDLRHFIETLEREGELRRIRVEVDAVLEIAEITDRISKRIGPALRATKRGGILTRSARARALG